jgi:hydroxylamine reductase
MTTNCIVPPKDTYKARLFTTGSAGFTGCTHIEKDEQGHKDFSVLIELAKASSAPTQIEEGEIIGGFAHNQVIALADKIVEAVKTGTIKKSFKYYIFHK